MELDLAALHELCRTLEQCYAAPSFSLSRAVHRQPRWYRHLVHAMEPYMNESQDICMLHRLLRLELDQLSSGPNLEHTQIT
jgi:hypothetical protein